jgi:hypothetical protein
LRKNPAQFVALYQVPEQDFEKCSAGEMLPDGKNEASAATFPATAVRQRAATADPEFRQRLVQTGQTPGGSSIEAVNASMRAEVKKWADVIQKAGIPAQ